jgi:hypothetical protein
LGDKIEILVDKGMRCGEMQDYVIARHGLPPDGNREAGEAAAEEDPFGWRIRKTDYAGMETNLCRNINQTVMNQFRFGDLFFLEEGLVPIKGQLTLGLWLWTDPVEGCVGVAEGGGGDSKEEGGDGGGGGWGLGALANGIKSMVVGGGGAGTDVVGNGDVAGDDGVVAVGGEGEGAEKNDGGEAGDAAAAAAAGEAAGGSKRKEEEEYARTLAAHEAVFGHFRALRRACVTELPDVKIMFDAHMVNLVKEVCAGEVVQARAAAMGLPSDPATLMDFCEMRELASNNVRREWVLKS